MYFSFFWRVERLDCGAYHPVTSATSCFLRHLGTVGAKSILDSDAYTTAKVLTLFLSEMVSFQCRRRISILTHTFACERQETTSPLLREEAEHIIGFPLLDGTRSKVRTRQTMPAGNDQGTWNQEPRISLSTWSRVDVVAWHLLYSGTHTNLSY